LSSNLSHIFEFSSFPNFSNISQNNLLIGHIITSMDNKSRLVEVRRQAKEISSTRSEVYRQLIAQSKENRKRKAISEKLKHLTDEFYKTRDEWRVSLAGTGASHGGATTSSIKLKSTISEEKRSQKIRKDEAISRANIAAQSLMKSQAEAIARAQMKEENNLAVVDLAHSNREDARNYKEAKDASRIQLAQRQHAIKSEKLLRSSTATTEQTKQSAVSIVERGPVKVVARVIRHGVNPAKDNSLVTNERSLGQDIAYRGVWSRVMKELKFGRSARRRGEIATTKLMKEKKAAKLEDDLVALEALDNAPSRSQRVKSIAMVAPRREDPKVVEAFERVFVDTSALDNDEEDESIDKDSINDFHQIVAGTSISSKSAEEDFADTSIDSLEAESTSYHGLPLAAAASGFSSGLEKPLKSKQSKDKLMELPSWRIAKTPMMEAAPTPSAGAGRSTVHELPVYSDMERQDRDEWLNEMLPRAAVTLPAHHRAHYDLADASSTSDDDAAGDMGVMEEEHGHDEMDVSAASEDRRLNRYGFEIAANVNLSDSDSESDTTSSDDDSFSFADDEESLSEEDYEAGKPSRESVVLNKSAALSYCKDMSYLASSDDEEQLKTVDAYRSQAAASTVVAPQFSKAEPMEENHGLRYSSSSESMRMSRSAEIQALEQRRRELLRQLSAHESDEKINRSLAKATSLTSTAIQSSPLQARSSHGSDRKAQARVLDDDSSSEDEISELGRSLQEEIDADSLDDDDRHTGQSIDKDNQYLPEVRDHLSPSDSVITVC
jgi:hypothetical protein